MTHQAAEELFLRGHQHSSQDQWNEALGAYEACLKIESHHAEAWRAKGLMLDRLGHHEKSVEASSRALDLDPQNDLACLNLSNVLIKLGRFDEALVYSSRAIKISPNEGSMWFSKAGCLLSLGRRDEGLECVQKAAELGNATALRLLAQIR